VRFASSMTLKPESSEPVVRLKTERSLSWPDLNISGERLSQLGVVKDLLCPPASRAFLDCQDIDDRSAGRGSAGW
jgi:hypothetical protein